MAFEGQRNRAHVPGETHSDSVRDWPPRINQQSHDILDAGGEFRRLAKAHCLDPMICPARKSKSLMIWTTLAPKLTPFGTSGCNANHINARRELLLEAGARHEQTPEAVSSTPLLEANPALVSEATYPMSLS
jgi:hypothetical protein